MNKINHIPTLIIINDLINRTTKIVIYSYQFIKLYCINKYNKNYIIDIFKVITIRKNNLKQFKDLIKFHKKLYSKTILIIKQFIIIKYIFYHTKQLIQSQILIFKTIL